MRARTSSRSRTRGPTSGSGSPSCSEACASTSSCAAGRHRRPSRPRARSFPGASDRSSGLAYLAGAAWPSGGMAVEGDLEHLVDRVDEDELDLLARLPGEVLEVCLVLARQDDL